MAVDKGVMDLDSKNHDRIHWKPRCIDYWTKWRSCVASTNQFHKYYQYGEFENCDVYQEDLKNCFRWKTRKSFDALDSLITRKQEEEGKKTSKFAHTVWTKRENPEKDWK
ncbi:UPF0545 protein C22orf39 homolog [Dendronephthya gigantea]|uniref:UPF0545 protein C22orf39 homolog n=1 Tax=Dendronephthya gigantea TaxID=151771 RepID=UPI00106AFFC0|nr:UPF0545 protein C22orf39 homolog [Dendronephthya gigantea]